MKPKPRSLLPALLAGLLITLLVLVAKDLLAARAAQPPAANPTGIWAGIVDHLPSGRTVECVFARDPTGSLALTCDWNTAH